MQRRHGIYTYLHLDTSEGVSTRLHTFISSKMSLAVAGLVTSELRTGCLLSFKQQIWQNPCFLRSEDAYSGANAIWPCIAKPNFNLHALAWP